jgi:hypothetical protein
MLIGTEIQARLYETLTTVTCAARGRSEVKAGLKIHILKVHGSNTLPDQMSTLLLDFSASDCEASSTDG